MTAGRPQWRRAPWSWPRLCRRRTRPTPSTVEESALELAASLPAADTPHGQAEAEELGRAISRFLRAQKEPARVVFLRRYWYADSVEQAAAHMGWSISKTKTVLYRTRNRLRDFLEQEGLWNG